MYPIVKDAFRLVQGRLKRYNKGVTYNLTKKEISELKTKFPAVPRSPTKKQSPRVNTPKTLRKGPLYLMEKNHA